MDSSGYLEPTKGEGGAYEGWAYRDGKGVYHPLSSTSISDARIEAAELSGNDPDRIEMYDSGRE